MVANTFITINTTTLTFTTTALKSMTQLQEKLMDYTTGTEKYSIWN